MTDQQLLVELLAIERAGWWALCESTGDRFYGELMTDDAVMVLANGTVMDRAAVTAALGQAPPWQRFGLSDPRVIPAGPDTAALVYVGTAERDGAEEPFVGAMSSVYQRVDGTWRLVLYQQTAVTG
ncbi:nuclear transport factor 2 family protein [Candidatus Mycolicibacterium alkanivorans]|uniref:Nuclear transport factor 2 family protein n=1 Tax=Candidatus Mycolicibacterium alkanivorans TaxID=2954114 RepID=A0ABS9Z0B0_9MYCO|nr:nuclear transport factor 2 family protein [Candidatus Mycolicibacterium alkanivorans]MCI4676930.1 nuclear transport factor 2 family protein [Candidatus Mycolicibacterium alkanivorans]